MGVTNLRRSSSWTSAMFELPCTSLSAACPPKRTVNKYLELLGDNEDSDGYQLPLQAPNSSAPKSWMNCRGVLTTSEQPDKCLPLSAKMNDDGGKCPSESPNFPSWLEDSDNWSDSTASTATFRFDSYSRRISATSSLSCLSGLEWNYDASQSSIC